MTSQTVSHRSVGVKSTEVPLCAEAVDALRAPRWRAPHRGPGRIGLNVNLWRPLTTSHSSDSVRVSTSVTRRAGLSGRKRKHRAGIQDAAYIVHISFYFCVIAHYSHPNDTKVTFNVMQSSCYCSSEPQLHILRSKAA